MSSANKTANLNMHSWVRTDPVVCDDFNENFNKIDAAIGEMRASYGNCEIYTGSYAGTGTQVYSLTFPKMPVFLLVTRNDVASYGSCFVREGEKFTYAAGSANLSLSGNTITFTNKSSTEFVINYAGKVYDYIAFAPARR